ncbi:C-C chemokine receptor type 8-like isoform X2 [Hyperolius riggenbachi]
MEEVIEYTPSTWDYGDSYGTIQPLPICERIEMESFLTILFYVLFCISMIGNGVIFVILVKLETFQSVTNIFFLNLVISDLVFSFTLPFLAISYYDDWRLGEAICKIQTAAFHIGFQSFVIFITLMTIDQYLTIVHSWCTTSTISVRFAVCISCASWLLSIILSIPDLLIYTVSNNGWATVCAIRADDHSQWWLTVGHYKHFVLFFLCPLAILIICYTGIWLKLAKCNIRRKSRVQKVIAIIAMMFFLCWTPYNLIMILLFQKQIDLFVGCNSAVLYIFHVSQVILFIHCCVNPFLYALLGTKFRRHLNCSFKRRSTRSSQQQEISLKTSTVNGL